MPHLAASGEARMPCITRSRSTSPSASRAQRRRTRSAYLDRIRHAARARAAPQPRCPAATSRTASPPAAAHDKADARGRRRPTSRIVTAYNDMLSAHQPYERFPDADQAGRARGRRRRRRSRAACRRCATASPRASAGMELSLFSRDVIALAAGGRALPRHVRRRAVPRHLRQDRAGPADGALSFGHLPAIFVPGRADAVGPAQRREGQGPPALRRGQGRPRRAARGRERSPTTAPAPAPSTAPPTPTRC